MSSRGDRHLELVLLVEDGIGAGIEPDVAEEVAGAGTELVGVADLLEERFDEVGADGVAVVVAVDVDAAEKDVRAVGGKDVEDGVVLAEEQDPGRVEALLARGGVAPEQAGALEERVGAEFPPRMNSLEGRGNSHGVTWFRRPDKRES